MRSICVGLEASSVETNHCRIVLCCMRMTPVFTLASVTMPCPTGEADGDWLRMRVNTRLVTLGTENSFLCMQKSVVSRPGLLLAVDQGR